MRRTVVPGGPHPCAGRSGVFLESDTEDRGQRADRERAAHDICQGCDARATCLGHAIARRERGAVWGGLNDAERDEIARQLRRQGA